MNVKIGTGPDSWGVWFPDDPRQTPWNRFLDEVVAAGYESIELGPYGYLPTELPVLQRELDKRGLKVSGNFIMAPLEDSAAWPRLDLEVVRTCETLAALDADFLIVIDDVYTDLLSGERRAPTELDDDAWRRLVDATHRIAELAARWRVRVAFHAHAETHVQYERQIERLLDDTEPDRVGLCFDVGHHAYCGGDPVAFLRKHSARVSYLHLKSVDRDIQRIVEQEHVPFVRAVEMGVFVEPESGAVDFVALRHALEELEYDGWAIVEQDMYPAPPEKPLPIAKRTREYLREIGIG